MVKMIEYEFGQNISRHEENRLTYLFDSVKKKGQRYAYFLCECGTVKEIRICAVTSRNKDTLSCGCLAKESVRKVNKSHGLSKHPLASTYYDMCKRCYNEKRGDYKHYGGRGIKVCDRWLGEDGLKNFISDLIEKPVGLEMDRIDVNDDYKPENVQWADRSNQCYNQRKGGSNTSGRVGVYWHKQSNRWRAQISHGNKTVGLGNHKTFEDAVKAREAAEMFYFGYSPNYEEE